MSYESIRPDEPHKKDHVLLTSAQRAEFVAKVAAAKQAEIERKAMMAQGVKCGNKPVRLPTYRWSNGIPCLPWKQN